MGENAHYSRTRQRGDLIGDSGAAARGGLEGKVRWLEGRHGISALCSTPTRYGTEQPTCAF